MEASIKERPLNDVEIIREKFKRGDIVKIKMDDGQFEEWIYLRVAIIDLDSNENPKVVVTSKDETRQIFVKPEDFLEWQQNGI